MKRLPAQLQWKAVINGKEYSNGVAISAFTKMQPEYLAKEVAQLVALNVELTLKGELSKK